MAGNVGRLWLCIIAVVGPLAISFVVFLVLLDEAGSTYPFVFLSSLFACLSLALSTSVLSVACRAVLCELPRRGEPEEAYTNAQ